MFRTKLFAVHATVLFCLGTIQGVVSGVISAVIPVLMPAVMPAVMPGTLSGGVISAIADSEPPVDSCLGPFLPRVGVDRERSLELERVVRAARDVFWSRKFDPAVKIDELSLSSPVVFLDSNIAFHLIGYLNSNSTLDPGLKEGFIQLERWLEKLETTNLKGSNLKDEIQNNTKFFVTPQVMRELIKHNMFKHTNGNVARIGFDSKETASSEYQLRPNQSESSAVSYHQIYESLIDRFYRQGLGVKSGRPKTQSDGIKDRRIITQLLFTTHLASPQGVPLRFVTRDIGVYFALFRMGILTGTLRGRDESNHDSFSFITKLDSGLQSELLLSLDKSLIQLLFNGAFDLTLNLTEASEEKLAGALGERKLQILAVPGVARDQIQSTLKLNSRAFRQFKERDAKGFYNWILAILKRADEQKLKIKVLIEDPTQLTENNRPQILNQELTYSIYKEKFNPESASKIMLLELKP